MSGTVGRQARRSCGPGRDLAGLTVPDVGGVLWCACGLGGLLVGCGLVGRGVC